MANIIVLEDDINRINKFKRELIGHYVLYFEHAKDCIEILNTDAKIDLLFLDRDLNGTQNNTDEKDEDTGSTVVKYLCDNKREIGHIIVHSLNSIEGLNMYNDLAKAKYSVDKIPFNLLKFQ